jgi:hypothetical protein
MSTQKSKSSFLKKRTKKLLPVAARTRVDQVTSMWTARGESFLLLFFKKEGLASS